MSSTETPATIWIGDLALEPIEPGDRIIAIRNADLSTRTLYVFGPGVYSGEQARTDWFSQDQSTDKLFDLDNGEVVWGIECWWGREERVTELYGGRTWTWVTVPVIGPTARNHQNSYATV
jgi:hypothetical protein